MLDISSWFEIGRLDDLARTDTPVHRLDARAKVFVTLVFICVVMSFPIHTISALIPFLLYPVILLSVGRIPVSFMAGRILLAFPFVLAVAVFNPVIDHQPMASFGPLTVTGGWISFFSILLRFILTVGAALSLVACTGMYRLGSGLEQIGCPRVFVVQLLFLYRYLFVVSEEASKMVQSVHLRAERIRSLPPRVYISIVGHLFLRAMDRADRVYRAMIVRGFDGQICVFQRQKFGWSDALFIAGSLGFFVAARVCNLADFLGRTILH